ncbi:V-set and transmembrane domain-containing protein 1-like isoform X2 [Myotis daubentonii]|uniref:V-set and transmembrane domain-containing protein 1-like isoform X2 n=1 Tax=Myotis daubentonii TaxID=98922 RepID=UPI002873758C|nr:V-set and transmembrane domain-containing protein 1-like isoform X2 [Myotis daubentonii]
MITGFLSLLCLGLCLGYDDVEHKNGELPRPSLHASPGSVVGRGGNVTLKCQGHLQNLTFMLGKWQDPGYRREQSSAGLDAEFLLTHLQPEHAGMYFCAYKTPGSHGWSEKSEHLHLQVTDTLPRPRPSLHASPGSVVGRGGNVTLKCQGHLQNLTFMLGKWQDPGYRREQSSAGLDAEFLLTHLQPEHAGMYFCAYKTPGSHGWSEKSAHLHLQVTDTLPRPRPSLHASPGSVVGRGGNVTLKCQGHLQNLTFMLGKWQDPGYRREQSSAGLDAEFLLTHLQPEHAGMYFCAYKTPGSHGWSEKSAHLHLQVTDNHDRLGASSAKTDSRVIFFTAFSCLAIFLLFPSVILIYRRSQPGSSHEESAKRTRHSVFPEEEASDLPKQERAWLSLSTEDPQEGTGADGNSKAPAEAAAASVPAEEPPGPGDCAT